MPPRRHGGSAGPVGCHAITPDVARSGPGNRGSAGPGPGSAPPASGATPPPTPPTSGRPHDRPRIPLQGPPPLPRGRDHPHPDPRRPPRGFRPRPPGGSRIAGPKWSRRSRALVDLPPAHQPPGWAGVRHRNIGDPHGGYGRSRRGPVAVGSSVRTSTSTSRGIPAAPTWTSGLANPDHPVPPSPGQVPPGSRVQFCAGGAPTANRGGPTSSGRGPVAPYRRSEASLHAATSPRSPSRPEQDRHPRRPRPLRRLPLPLRLLPPPLRRPPLLQRRPRPTQPRRLRLRPLQPRPNARPYPPQLPSEPRRPSSPRRPTRPERPTRPTAQPPDAPRDPSGQGGRRRRPNRPGGPAVRPTGPAPQGVPGRVASRRGHITSQGA